MNTPLFLDDPINIYNLEKGITMALLSPGVYVSVTKVSIVVDQIVVIQVNNQAGSERLLHRLAAIHRRS